MDSVRKNSHPMFHSMAIKMKDDYGFILWEKGLALYDIYSQDFYVPKRYGWSEQQLLEAKEEIKNLITAYDDIDYFRLTETEKDTLTFAVCEGRFIFDFESYSRFRNESDYFKKEFTTPNGETIVVFGCYGHL